MQSSVTTSRVCWFLLQSGLDRETWIDDDDGNEWQMPTSRLQDPVAETVGQTAEEAAAKLLQVSLESQTRPHSPCCQPTPCLPTLPLALPGRRLPAVCMVGSLQRLTRFILFSEQVKHVPQACLHQLHCTAGATGAGRAAFTATGENRNDTIQGQADAV